MKKFLLGTVFGVATAATAFAVKEIVEKKVAEEVEAELARRNDEEDECDEDCPGCVTGFGVFGINDDDDDETSEESDDEKFDEEDEDESPIRKFLSDVLGVSVETHKCNSFAEFMECVARDMKESGVSDEEIEDAVNKAKAVKSATDDAETAADKAESKDVKSDEEVKEDVDESANVVEEEAPVQEAESEDDVDIAVEEPVDDAEETFETDIPDPTPEDVDA